ncbi:MAG: UDP-2,3-diacylglucosamine diphosphatase LpxI [Candidatus Omnitrophota bacterium]
MKLGILAGNRLLPILLAKNIKEKDSSFELVAVCFKGETSKAIVRYVDRVRWVSPANLGQLRQAICVESLNKWIMAGQVNPLRIFNPKSFDEELSSLVNTISDFRPHNIFSEIIRYLERDGVKFLDSTLYMREFLAEGGVLNNAEIDDKISKDIDFGASLISRFVELDVGQTIVIKEKTAVALEGLEGTDRTIKRAFKIAGCGLTVLKFAKHNQDVRFDVPVVGMATLNLLRKIKAKAIVLEKDKVIILQKDEFLSSARKWGIAVVGRERV